MVNRNALVHSGLLAGLLVLALSGTLQAEDAPPPSVPPPPAEPDQEAPAQKKAVDPFPGDVDWDALKQSFVEDKKAFVLSGSAFVRYRGIKLEADNIVFFRETREVYAEGNIRLRIGESELAAETAYIDINNDVGYLVDAVARVSAPPDALAGIAGPKKSKEEIRDEEQDKLRQLSPDKLGVPTVRSRDPFGVYVDPIDDPQARANLIFRAKKVIYHSKMHMSAEDAFVTSDDMVHPMYGLQAGKLEFFMKEIRNPDRPDRSDLRPHKLVVKRGRINILGVSLFPFPTITYDMMKKNAFFSTNSGSSQRWGPFILNRIGYGLGGGEDRLFDPTRVYLDLDERYKRGPGGGVEFEWQTGLRPPESTDERVQFERGQGHIRLYGMGEIQTSRQDDIIRARRDLERRVQPKFDGFPRRVFDANLLFTRRRKLQDAGPPSFEIDEHRDEFRGLADFAHHQPLKRFAGLDNLQVDLKYERQTDRDFMLEYFQNNYMTENQPEALASVRKPGDNYSVELLYRGNTQDFDGAPPRSPVDFGTFTNYQPALTYSLTPTPLYCGFVVTGEVQAARLEKDFERRIYDLESHDANRVYAKVDVARPFKVGVVNVVPHIGTQQQGYDNSRTGNSVYQGALTYGVDMTTRFYGTFDDYENDALGIRGMRHIIEPRITYDAVGDTRESAEDMLDFDPIDDLTPVDKITFAIDQTVQTRRPTRDGKGMRTVNFAGFDAAIDYFPAARDQDRLLDGDATDLLRLDGFLRVVDVVRFDGSLGVGLDDGQVEKAAYAITIDPQTRWRLRFEERYNFDNDNRKIIGSDQFRVKFEYQLSERWGFAMERIQERRRSQLTKKGRQVERITVTRSYGALDVAFTYAVDRNVDESSTFFTVKPALVYRNLIVPTQDLLVDAGEVSGDDQEAPEERNFDPIEMLRSRSKKKKGPARKGDDAPPPPLTPRDQDVPVPPPPAPDKRAEFEDPYKRRRDPAKVDDDDWTTPPSQPASTRKQ